jgi:LVIVD repeat
VRARLSLALLIAAAAVAALLLATALFDPPAPAASDAPPGRLALVGHDPLLDRGMNSALAVHGTYAYVGSRTDGTHPNSGVLVVDISDPANPRVTGQVGPPDQANPGESSRELRVWPERDLLIVMNFQCDGVGHACAEEAEVAPSFRFYDIRGEKAGSPRLVSTYHPSRNPHEFFIWDDPHRRGRALLYITTPFSEGATLQDGPHLVVTDISAARQGRFRELAAWSPERDRRYDEAGIHSLTVSRDGRRAYLADLEGGFAVADTSDLARSRRSAAIRQLTPPTATVHHDSPGVHSALRLPGRPYALITDEVYGAAFGLGPLIGFNVLKGCPWGWARTVDVRDPGRPRLAGEYKVLPYNDPSQCSAVTPTQNNGASFSSHNPTVTRSLALMTWHSAGLQVASLRDPRRPRQAAEFRPDPLPAVVTEDPALSAGTEKVVMWSYPIVRNGLIYTVDLRNGLYVNRYEGPYATELGCYAFLEGNSNLVRRRRACGMRLRLRVRRRCGRRARLSVRGADRRRVRRVEFVLRGRRVARDRRPPFSRRVSARRIGPRRARAVVTVDDGSRVPLAARVRRCRRG